MVEKPRSEFDRLCVELGLSTADAARKLGVPWRTVYRWRIGETKPSRMAQEKIEQLRGGQ